MTSNNYITRSATLSDLEILLEFEQGIISTERPFDPSLANDPINYYDLAELIKSEEAEVVVTEYRGKVVASGYAKIKTAAAYLDHSRYAYLGFMYTEPNHRGKGVNKFIVDKLRLWSKERGLKEIRLTVYEENLGAIRAYEKVGFKKHLIEMRIE